MQSFFKYEHLIDFIKILSDPNDIEKLAEFWKLQGRIKIQQLATEKFNTNQAKNVVLFIGNGMSFSTVAATRMLLGGEEKSLSFEEFSHVGFSKVNLTYLTSVFFIDVTQNILK